MTLQVGQVVRYESRLWRVDYINACRARLVPLARRHVVIKDDDGDEVRSFDAERGGVNIAPTSELPVVTDLERAKDEIELEQAEAELRLAQREVAKPVAAPKPAKVPRAPHGGAHPTPGPRSTGGWGLGPVSTPALREGSQAALVVAWLTTHPGADMVAISAALPTVTNLPQCLSRLKLTGYLVRV